MSKRDPNQGWRQITLTRDRSRCLNCGATSEAATKLDIDHGVPRGAGGADRMSNLNTLCRDCHEAKHGNGIAPSVQMESTGEMSKREFIWFKHFIKEMVPAMADVVGTKIRPKFNLDEQGYWYIPVGDVIALNKQLAESDARYESVDPVDYM